MYDKDSVIRSLSQQLKVYFKPNPTSLTHVDAEIVAHDVRYNLSAVLTELLLALRAPYVSKADIENEIAKYNLVAGTDYSYDFFWQLGWIRLVNNRYIIPKAILSNIWKVENPKGHNPQGHPVDFEEETRALLPVYTLLRENERTAISAERLLQLMEKHTREIGIDFLEERGVVSKNEQGEYSMSSDRYVQQLRNRIALQAWYKIMGENRTLEDFRRFVDFLNFVRYYPEAFAERLSHDDQQHIVRLSLALLDNEDDLKDASLEIQKSRLDAETALSPFKLSDPVLKVDFNLDDVYLFAEEVDHWRRYDQALFGVHNSRTAYYPLIRFLFDIHLYNKRYESIIELLKTTRNPTLKSHILWEMEYRYAEIRPYFAVDVDLAPLAFWEWDRLQFSEEWTKSDVDLRVTKTKGEELKERMWHELLDLFMNAITESSEPEWFSKPLALVLQQVSKDVFKYNDSNYISGEVMHRRYRSRYEYTLDLLRTLRMKQYYYHSSNVARPLLAGNVLPGIISELPRLPRTERPNGLLSFPIADIDLYGELLRLVQPEFLDGNIYRNVIDTERLKGDISQVIVSLLKGYFTIDQVGVFRWPDEIETVKVSRSSDEFGIELVDFAFIFANLESQDLLQHIGNVVEANIHIDPNASLYDDVNREEVNKIRAFMKLILIGYTGLSQKQMHPDFKGLPVEETLHTLERLIKEYAIKYSKSKVADGEIDVFKRRSYVFRKLPFVKELDSLLYEALNYFPRKVAAQMIDNIFDDANDFGKLITALNRVNSKDLSKLLMEKIEKVDYQQFIDSAITITELENVLIEVINSRSLYHYAQPFLDEIEKHIEGKKINNADYQLFLYRVKLLQALKAGDYSALEALEPPKMPHSSQKENEGLETKRFYLALYQLQNVKDYNQAMLLFAALSNAHPTNVKYGVYLYQARAYSELFKGERLDGKEKWDEFAAKVKNDPSLADYAMLVQSIDLLYYIWDKNASRVDQTVNVLLPSYLYQKILIKPVCEHYIQRDIPERAFDYLNKAIKFYSEEGEDIRKEFEELKDSIITDQYIVQIGLNVSALSSLPPAVIPKVLPPVLNDKKKLNEFILGEILGGLRIMREKIVAVESIINEDRYSDVLLAILRYKFALFGWDISDQARVGISASGKDTGEIDILLKAGGNVLTLIEALNLEGGDFYNLEKHVKKCIEYNRSLTQYFIIVYYKGKREKYEDFLKTYEKDMSDVQFDAGWEMKTGIGLTQLNDQYNNSENIYLAKSLHGPKDYEIFHVVIDLSVEPVDPEESDATGKLRGRPPKQVKKATKKK
jgi:hypothetical protein